MDAGQINQVLLNLYVNAWQAMPNGGELYLQTANVFLDKDFIKPHKVSSGNYVKISVTDTGIGMDKSMLGRIFDPFFSTKGMGRGTGLGLASAYGILENHNGAINVYSEVGKGTSFTIYLPSSEKEIVKDVQIPMTPETGSGTILLVDDEEIILEVAQPMLELLGYDVLIAGNGKEALEILKAGKMKIDLVILDMIMPGMSGSATFDKIQALNTDIKVLLSSGYSMNGDATDILSRGCAGFIQKPFNINELSEKIQEVLR